MPLSAEQRQIVLEDISSILERDVKDELHTYYAQALDASETHPEQASKEVRDAVTHLGRALTAETIEAAQRDIAKARDHLTRAKRDCLKITIVFADDRVRQLFEEVRSEHGAVAANYRTRRKQLRAERKEIFLAESNGSDGVTLRLLALSNKYGELEDDIIAEYSMPQGRLPWHGRALRFALGVSRRRIVPALFGLALGVLSTFVALVLAPDGEEFGRNVRRTLGIDVGQAADVKPVVQSPEASPSPTD